MNKTLYSDETATDEPFDPQSASSARALAREQRVRSGIEDLQRWLHDLLRQGFASVQQQPFSFWEQAAARLMDAQAPGLARMVRALPAAVASGSGWPDRLLERIARIHLLCEGYARLASLPAPTQADIRTAIGWNISREQVAERPGVADEWRIVGQRVSDDDNLRTQRSYLYGALTQRWALMLDFAPGHQPLDRTLLPGTEINGELAFYPSAAPLRALLRQQPDTAQRFSSLAGHSLSHNFDRFAAAIARAPWLETYPMLLADAVPLVQADSWYVSLEQHVVPLAVRAERRWQLLAISGGHPVTLMGEWNGESLTPLGVWAEGVFSDLG